MILLGNKDIPFEKTNFIQTHTQINNTEPNSTVIFNYNLELMKYCNKNDVLFAVVITSIKEAIFSNSLNARYIICDKSLAKQIQDIATNYMFDSRVLSIIEDDKEIEEIALQSIDGVIYKGVLD